MRIQRAIGGLLCVLILPCTIMAADVPATKAATKPVKGLGMDYGPFISFSVLKPRPAPNQGVKSSVEKHKNGDPTPLWKAGELIATKGITVNLGESAAVCFDADTCRYAAGWIGGFVDVSQSNLTRNQGPWPLIATGSLVFTTPDRPNWTFEKDWHTRDPFADPRPKNSDPRLKGGEGPLPKKSAHYRGLYRDGKIVIFSYTVGDVEILDMPGASTLEGHTFLTRTLRVGPHAQAMVMQICGEGTSAKDTSTQCGPQSMMAKGADRADVVRVAGASARLQHFDALYDDDSGFVVEFRPSNKPAQFTLAIGNCDASQTERECTLLNTLKFDEKDISEHTKGGPALWKEPIETAGELGDDASAYTIDTVAMPNQNPWKCWMKPSGFDFFADGRAAVCTLNGDVWIVSRLDAKLDHVKWKRFAAGLYEPLGLKIVDDQIYVLDRTGIVRLHDLNHSGEANFYENFNNDLVSDANYHSFHMDLQTDREGNFYYAVTGNQMPLAKPDHSCVVKVSRYGDKAEVISTGLRAANGLGMGPHDELTAGDNQGHWVPASPIYRVSPGAFFGYHGDPRRVSSEEFAAHLKQHPINDLPICWVPYSWDNSAGGQVWAGKNWGPFSKDMLHLSYGKCTLFAVLSEQLHGTWQGGVVAFPGKFDSGIMRGRLSPSDGQIWLCGLKGWQNNAAHDGCLQRMRYTGKPCYMPNELHITPAGIHVGFPVELDPESVRDEGSYTIEVWGYQVSEKYGSDEFKVSDPKVKGHDSLEIKRATLSADKRHILIEVEGLKPVTQYVLKMRLNAADGSKIKCDIGGSIWKTGDGSAHVQE